MDPSQIDQILANLCVNARDAIKDTGKITIETKAHVFDNMVVTDPPETISGNYVCLTVSDDGSGMIRDVLTHLFEPFFTTKGLGKGTGLGLATVYGIVKQNNGFIRVESEVGRGSSFHIYLPAYLHKADSEELVGVALQMAVGKETILIVEDEVAILRVGKRSLENLGYTVLAASTPSEAIRIAEEYQGTIHLLMTDVVMPELNGRDLARRLAVMHPNMKQLYMSGYTADVIGIHGVLEEGVHFMQKPFAIPVLAEKVRQALDVPVQ
jgi:CheY-like chemotaxis protein